MRALPPVGACALPLMLGSPVPLPLPIPAAPPIPGLASQLLSNSPECIIAADGCHLAASVEDCQPAVSVGGFHPVASKSSYVRFFAEPAAV